MSHFTILGEVKDIENYHFYNQRNPTNMPLPFFAWYTC